MSARRARSLLAVAVSAALVAGVVLVAYGRARAQQHDAATADTPTVARPDAGPSAVAPPSALAPAGAPTPARPTTPEDAARDASLDTPLPAEWLPPGPAGCKRRGPMRGMCKGPRRVPRASEADAERARALGVGTLRAATRLLIGAPEPRWVEAARGEVATEAREDTPAHELRPPPGDLLFPVSGAALWRGYGATRRGRRRHNHQGLDLGAPGGTPFRAANDGLVAYADNGMRGYGNLLIVVHPDATATFYAHCRAVYVPPGARVRRGQVLGEVGRTGYAHGDHLHFEWHSEGAARNPLPHFTALPAHIRPSAAQLEERVLPLDRSVFHRPRGRHRGRETPPRRRAERRARSRRAP
jgi:murein DD-endopeptidase MepM/ murein hydrolase activator NlpD